MPSCRPSLIQRPPNVSSLACRARTINTMEMAGIPVVRDPTHAASLLRRELCTLEPMEAMPVVVVVGTKCQLIHIGMDIRMSTQFDPAGVTC